MRSADEILEKYKEIWKVTKFENNNAAKDSFISALKEYACEVIDECVKLSVLKWSTGESGILTKKDKEILKANLK